MKKFILACEPDSEKIVRLSGKDYHYLVNVRRLAPGNRLNAILPDGSETELMVCSTAAGVLTAKVLENEKGDSQLSQSSSLSPIILFQALPKGSKMDLIIRQATEGGISEIVPFESEYSSIKIKSLGRDKPDRWQRIIKEARQQSGSSIPTTVKAPQNFDQMLDYWEEIKDRYTSPGTGILLHHEVLGTPLEQGTFHHYLGSKPGFVVLAIGPEGGFSQSEAGRFLTAGFRPIKMGDTTLRTETAALYGAAAIRIILLESAAWQLNRKT